MKKELSERQKNVYNFIRKHMRKNGYPPTVREIGEAIGVKSTSLVTYYLKQLEEMNMIERDHNVSRGVRLTSQVKKSFSKAASAAKDAAASIQEMLSIPVLGRIVAGEPISTPASDFTYFDAESNIQIARSLLSAKEKTSELFALEVEGTSMIDAMVNDGDMVIMKKAETARNGEMVAVWLKASDQTTLKYFYKEL